MSSFYIEKKSLPSFPRKKWESGYLIWKYSIFCLLCFSQNREFFLLQLISNRKSSRFPERKRLTQLQLAAFSISVGQRNSLRQAAV